MAKIIRNDDKINSGIQESRNAINGLNSINQKLSNISEFPRIGGSKISAAIGECTSKISEISSSLGSVESSIQGALMELNSVDYESMNQILSSMANHEKLDFSDATKVAEMVLEGYGSKSYISKDDLKIVLMAAGLSEKRANKIIETHGDLSFFNELIYGNLNLWSTGAKFAANCYDFVTGEGDVEDVIESGCKLVTKKVSTEVVLNLAAAKGVGNIVEGVVDGLILLGSAPKVARQEVFDFIFGTDTATFLKETTMDITGTKVVDSAYDFFYQKTLPGKIINEYSVFDYDGSVATTTTNVSENAIMIGISCIPGVGPLVAGVTSGLKAAGEKAEKEFSKENRNYWGGTTQAVLTGSWEGAQWYLGAKVGGTLNATSASQVSGKFASKLYNATSKLPKGGKMAVSAGSEAIVGGADTIVRTSIDNINDNRSWDQIFKEDYGGWSGVATNATIAAGIDIGFDVAGNLFGKVKNRKTDIPNNNIEKVSIKTIDDNSIFINKGETISSNVADNSFVFSYNDDPLSQSTANNLRLNNNSTINQTTKIDYNDLISKKNRYIELSQEKITLTRDQCKYFENIDKELIDLTDELKPLIGTNTNEFTEDMVNKFTRYNELIEYIGSDPNYAAYRNMNELKSLAVELDDLGLLDYSKVMTDQISWDEKIFVSKINMLQNCDEEIKPVILNDILYKKVRDNTSEDELISLFNNNSDILSLHYKNKARYQQVQNGKPIFENIDEILSSEHINKYKAQFKVVDTLNYFFGTFGYNFKPLNHEDVLVLTPESFKNLYILTKRPNVLGFCETNIGLTVIPSNSETSTVVHEIIHYLAMFDNGKTGFFDGENSRGINEGATEFLTDAVMKSIDPNYSHSSSSYDNITDIFNTMSYLMDEFSAHDGNVLNGFDGISSAYFEHDNIKLHDYFIECGGNQEMWDNFVQNANAVAGTADDATKKMANQNLAWINAQLLNNGCNKIESLKK